MENTTIAAISTPTGSGGIGIVRISGQNAVDIGEQMFSSHSGKKIKQLSGYCGMLGNVFDHSGIIDEVIIYRYIAPKSYTGEDIIEISCHGGSFVLNKVLRTALNLGAVVAEAGEFTKRAFLNGKLDLINAEAVMDIINAQSDASVKVANDMRTGKLSNKIDGIIEKLVNQSAHLAAWSDYPDEDMEMVNLETLGETVSKACGDIEALLKSYDYGRILKEGIPTAIVGKPNVGKSTLMNLLTGYETSIVSDVPGTTRDIVKESIRLGDFVLQISDTAGIRDTTDSIEQVGVERAKTQMENAQLVIAMFDNSKKLSPEDYSLIELIENLNTVIVINKSDLQSKIDIEFIESKFNYIIEISAKENSGVENLSPIISNILNLDRFNQGDSGIINNERQRSCLVGALAELENAQADIDLGITLDALSVSLEAALDSLMAMTGRKAGEEIVSQVFAQFCVGK